MSMFSRSGFKNKKSFMDSDEEIVVMQRGGEGKRRIKPVRCDSKTVNPAFELDDDDVIIGMKQEIVDGDVIIPRNLTAWPTMIMDDIDDTPVRHKRLPVRVGDVVGMGMPGFVRPALPQPEKRKAARQLIDVESDSDEEEVVRHVPVIAGNGTVGRGALATRYCITWNNPELDGDEFKTFLEGKADIKMAVFQKESGETGTEHFQCYLELNKRMYTTGVQTLLSPYRMSLLHAKGTKIQNHVYCTKDEGRIEGPWYVKCNANEFKRKNGNQGKRSDLDDYAALVIAEGGITATVIEQMPGHAMAFSKHAKNLVSDLKYADAKAKEKAYWKEQWEKRQRGETVDGQKQRQLELYFGPTAVGKTTEVKLKVQGELGEDLYEKDARSQWWGNYNGEKHVLLDEYRGGQTIDEFKMLTNVGLTPIQGKGTELILQADCLYYTSNCHPSRWWKRNTDEFETWISPDYKAMVRRFAKVYWWNDAGTLTVLENPGKKEDGREWKTKWAKWQAFWEWRDAAGKPAAGSDDYFTL